MRSTSAWFLGRCGLRWIVLTWALTLLISILAWNASVEVPGSANGTLISARLTVPLAGFVVHLWLTAPAMPTWETIGIRRIRVITAISTAGGIVLACTALLASIWYVTKAPASIVPGYFIGVDDLLDIQWPLVHNILILTGLAAISVCLFGRAIGTGAAVVAYLLLVIAGADTQSYHLVPYFSHAFGIPVTHHPIAATLFPVVAVWTWGRTGGTAALARKLDPR